MNHPQPSSALLIFCAQFSTDKGEERGGSRRGTSGRFNSPAGDAGTASTSAADAELDVAPPSAVAVASATAGFPAPPSSDKELNKRNAALIANIRGALDDAQFDSFRQLSAAFRRGDLSADGYYAQFRALFPDARRRHAMSPKGEAVFRELVALLPDASLRTALKDEYAALERSRTIESEFPTLNDDAPPVRLRAYRGGSQWSAPANSSDALDASSFPSLGGGGNNNSKRKTAKKGANQNNNNNKGKKQGAGHWAKAAARGEGLLYQRRDVNLTPDFRQLQRNK